MIAILKNRNGSEWALISKNKITKKFLASINHFRLKAYTFLFSFNILALYSILGISQHFKYFCCK